MVTTTSISIRVTPALPCLRFLVLRSFMFTPPRR
jgi:hypothetical protein